ncbi:hypothetical protein [Muricoccus radiodurans]|uniref:hypothetical protein n=1 Tax=Muricoccus radiodurans TaxID=2231721 RepID=UPI003CEB3594
MRRAAVLLALILSLAAPARAAPCGAGDDLIEPIPLPATSAAISQRALSVLVVGSASVMGPGSSGPSSAYPSRLEGLLRRVYPEVRVEVVARGGRGLMAADHAALIRDAMRELRPGLVLWQAATVEAVRGSDIAEMTEALRAGTEAVRSGGADLIVLDPQWSRFLRANADVEPYRDALRAAAVAEGAGFLSRYDLMRAWAEAETVDVERAPRERRTAEVDKLNDCLARSLAQFVTAGVAGARR